MMSMLYQAYQNHMDLTAPWRSGAASALKYLNLVPQGVSDRLFGRLAAALELLSRTSLTYTRPAYGLDQLLVGNRELEVAEEVPYATPSGTPGNPDLDGGADRHPNPADQGQPVRQEQAAEVVRGEPDQLRAVAMQGRVPPGLSRLRAAHRLCVDESRAPHQAAHRARQPSRKGREGKGGNHQDLL